MPGIACGWVRALKCALIAAACKAQAVPVAESTRLGWRVKHHHGRKGCALVNLHFEEVAATVHDDGATHEAGLHLEVDVCLRPLADALAYIWT